MKTLRLVSMLLTVSVAFACQQTVLTQESAKAKLQKIYDQMNALAMKKDASGLAKLMKEIAARDYFGVDKSGAKLTLAQETASLYQQISRISEFTKAKGHIESVSIKLNSAVVLVSSSYELSTKPTPNGKSHVYSGTAMNEDTWVYLNGTWKRRIARTIRTTASVDGKLVRDGK